MNVPVVFISDDNYIIPTSVAIASLIFAKSPDTHYDIYIVCASLSEESEAAFSAFASDSVAIHVIREDANRFSSLHHFSSAAACVASPSALLKFVLPELLPEQDKVLYLDGDILARVDLSELYATDLEDNMVAAVIDSGSIYYKQEFTSRVEHYFNSGVMVLNLKQMRLENMTETLICTKQELNDSNLMDQNVLNVVFDHRVKCLPIWYNFLAINLHRSRKKWELSDINELYGTQFQSREELFDSWKILHFASKDKPWKNPLVLFADKWMKVYRCLPQPIKAAVLRVEQSNPIEIQTAVSVIIPVYNVEQYLRQSLDCILGQTLTDIEVICVDDGSTDQSPVILEEYAQKDTRMKVLRQENRGAGAARNLGFSHATGTYVYFFDADDLCSPELLKKTVNRAEETEADIVAFDFVRFHEDGTVEKRVGIHADWLPPETEVFSYRDCPDRIMSVINPTPWNKLCRTAFLREHQLKYEEISSSNDITFSAVSAASAERISFLKEELFQYRVGHANTISSTKSTKLYNVLTAVTSAFSQVKRLPYYDEIKPAAQLFAIESYLFAMENCVTDFNAPACREYYEQVHCQLSGKDFAGVTQEQLRNLRKWMFFSIVRKHDYETMQTLLSRRLIVSLTSFPARIQYVADALESIYNQNRQADLVVLYLAQPQFPEKEADLPTNLLTLVAAGKLEIRWCSDDLRPHKKYFYAMQDFPEDLIVTIDDDLQYDKTMLESLYRSYLLYPNAVSTVRAHLIILSETGEVLPYRYWAKEVDGCLYRPSLYLLATGGAGVLYPPNLMPQALFDKEAILSVCPAADDLWLKTMELMNGVPVALASEYKGLHYVKGSQEVGLRYTNVDQNENDVQLAQINRWLAQTYGEGIWKKWLTAPGCGEDFSGIIKVCEIYTKGQKQDRRRVNAMNRKLQRIYAEKNDQKARIKELKKQVSALKKENASLRKENKAQAKKLRSLRRSASFRIGRVITWPVRKLRRLLAKLRH
ncbi:MAG: glycosyltransferase [Clostridiales bacterium]|nr:glycosyltransferase [Clostridiales bacterium]